MKSYEGRNPNPIGIKDIERAIEILSDINTKAKDRDASYAIIMTQKEIRAMTYALKVALNVYEGSWSATPADVSELKDLIKNFGEIA